jgi:hypothetical protein
MRLQILLRDFNNRRIEHRDVIHPIPIGAELFRADHRVVARIEQQHDALAAMLRPTSSTVIVPQPTGSCSRTPSRPAPASPAIRRHLPPLLHPRACTTRVSHRTTPLGAERYVSRGTRRVFHSGRQSLLVEGRPMPIIYRLDANSANAPRHKVSLLTIQSRPETAANRQGPPRVEAAPADNMFYLTSLIIEGALRRSC